MEDNAKGIKESSESLINEYRQKPPLGIMPFWLMIKLRATEIRNAMLRYEEAKKPIPEKWDNELAILDKFISEGNETADKFPFNQLKEI